MPDVQPRFKAPAKAKRSKMTRDAVEMREVRRALLERSQGRCEARFSPLCTGVGTEAHHLKRRSAGGMNTVDNCVWVDAHCHARIHAAPAEAIAAGLLLPSWA